MAKQQTARSTIRNDPFETLIPDRLGEEAEVIQHPTAIRVAPEAKKPGQAKSQKVTVVLSDDLVNRLRNIVYWSQNPKRTIAGILEEAAEDAVKRIEKEHGGQYPQRPEELKGGRPTRS
jgi:hypothetical protein